MMKPIFVFHIYVSIIFSHFHIRRSSRHLQYQAFRNQSSCIDSCFHSNVSTLDWNHPVCTSISWIRPVNSPRSPPPSNSTRFPSIRSWVLKNAQPTSHCIERKPSRRSTPSSNFEANCTRSIRIPRSCFAETMQLVTDYLHQEYKDGNIIGGRLICSICRVSENPNINPFADYRSTSAHFSSSFPSENRAGCQQPAEQQQLRVLADRSVFFSPPK